MKKSELIKALKDHGLTDEEIKEMDYNEMKEKLKELESEGGDTEVKEESQAVAEETDNGDGVLTQFTVQLHVYENRIVNVPDGACRVLVENVGDVGEVYVDVISVNFNPRNLILPGDKKEFKGVKRLYVGSASRPTVRFTFFK